MFKSAGVIIKSPTTQWSGPTSQIPDGLQLGSSWSQYGALYVNQLWVHILTQKLAAAQARLPLKTYLRDDLNRPEATGSPYAQLLAQPSKVMSRYDWWMRMSLSYDVYGEAFAWKKRDAGGRPVELVPLDPTWMSIQGDSYYSDHPMWQINYGAFHVENIPSHDLFHPFAWNPVSRWRGLSRLEPLRRTIEFEDAAQRAQSSFWKRGARPGMTLEHPKTLSKPAQERLRAQFDDLTAGADNTGRSVLLEEGMKANALTINANEAQYIESRKLNREEVCAAYDVPPPVVHILDRATFSNITEQMRSMYRDTMAPRLKFWEEQLEFSVRASVQPGRNEPDFGGDVYAEFLLDEVLRGDFEVRANAYQQADWMTTAEKRRAENLPFIDGTDSLFVNAAETPLEGVGYNAAYLLVRAGFDPAAVLAALGLPAIAHSGVLPITVQPDPSALPPGDQSSLPGPPANVVRTVLGRISNLKTLDAVDIDRLVEGLNGDAALIRAAFNASKTVGEDLPMFRAHLAALTKEHS